MEEPIFQCEICSREFKSTEALEMHNKAKHSSSKEEQKIIKPVSVNFKRIRNWGIFILILGLAVWGIYALMADSSSFGNEPVTEMNIGGHNNLALHIHSDLSIRINGTEQEIPANIGILPGVMRPLHTHDSTGEIHIEGPYARDFTLGEFFQIWGRTFNSSCIFEYCMSNGTLEMTVNGEKSEAYENLVLRDDDEILVEFSSVQ